MKVYGLFYTDPIYRTDDELHTAELATEKVFLTEQAAEAYRDTLGSWWKYQVVAIPVEE